MTLLSSSFSEVTYFLTCPSTTSIPQHFYFLKFLAPELLVYCSQLLTVAEGNNGNDPLKQLLTLLAKISSVPKQPKGDNAQTWQYKAMQELVLLFHWPQIQQNRFLVSLTTAAHFCMFVTDYHLFHFADSVFGWLSSIVSLVPVLKTKPTKVNLASTLVTIFKPENVTVLLWDTTKIKHSLSRRE